FGNKRAFKFPLPRTVRGKGVAGLGFTSRLNRQQFAGDVAHGALGMSFRLRPARAGERVERRTRLARANVFADEVRFGDGNVEFRRFIARIVGSKFDYQTFGFGSRISDLGS